MARIERGQDGFLLSYWAAAIQPRRGRAAQPRGPF